MVGNNLTDLQLQQLVDRTIIKADLVILLIYLRITMEKSLILSLKIWSKILTLEESLRSIKFELRVNLSRRNDYSIYHS